MNELHWLGPGPESETPGGELEQQRHHRRFRGARAVIALVELPKYCTIIRDRISRRRCRRHTAGVRALHGTGRGEWLTPDHELRAVRMMNFWRMGVLRWVELAPEHDDRRRSASAARRTRCRVRMPAMLIARTKDWGHLAAGCSPGRCMDEAGLRVLGGPRRGWVVARGGCGALGSAGAWAVLRHLLSDSSQCRC